MKYLTFSKSLLRYVTRQSGELLDSRQTLSYQLMRRIKLERITFEANPTRMIVKSKQFKNYTVVDNAILKERNLSLKAKGLFCILTSLPSNWNVVQSQLNQFSNDGITATTAAFKELIEYGVVRVICKDDSKSKSFRGNLSYIVFPSLEIASRSSDEVRQAADALSENPTMENPSMENPSVENPSVENQTLQSKELQKTIEQKTVEKSKGLELYPDFMKIYYEFYKRLNGFPPKINAAEGKALKGIIAYLVECANKPLDALSAWEYTLTHWGDLSAFTQRRMRLCDINSSLGNILIELKQHKSKPTATGGAINRQYESTLQNLLKERSNG